MADSKKPSGDGDKDGLRRRLAEMEARQTESDAKSREADIRLREVNRSMGWLLQTMIFVSLLILSAIVAAIAIALDARNQADEAKAAVNALSDDLKDKEIQRLQKEIEALKATDRVTDSPPSDSAGDSPPSNSPANDSPRQ